MKFRFADKDLRSLYTETRLERRYELGVPTAFRKRVQTIGSAPDERMFREMRSLRYERLKGKRSHQYSMRLNDQWRLILEYEEDEVGEKVVVLISIEDYHD